MSYDPPPYVYASVVEFVEGYLTLVYRRVVDDTIRVWCPEWWQHAEAVVRLDALWRTWEYYRLDGRTGLSVWLLDHADPHMRQLFDPDGPFHGCSVQKGHANKLPPLPLKAVPGNLFRDPTLSRED
jgi:hypothetical protein